MHSFTEYGARTALAVLLATALQVSAPAHARDRVGCNLSGDGAARASGRVRALISDPSHGRLEVRVRDLPPGQSFDVLVGTVKVGTILTDGGGQGRLRFRSRPHGHDLLLGFDPRGAMITIRDATGTDVLVGTVAARQLEPTTRLRAASPTTAAPSARIAPSKRVRPRAARRRPPAPACPIRAPTWRRRRTTSSAACRTTAVPNARIAALPNAQPVAASSWKPRSCTPNPCAATPPADPDIQCCLPDDSGTECEDRTPEQCAAQGGINMGPGSCTPNPCAATPAPGNESGDDHGGESGHGRHGGRQRRSWR